MDIEATDIVVTGRVQGVFYRAGMREQAERLDVAGWVRNEPDGSVRAHLEGAGPQRSSELLDIGGASGTPASHRSLQRNRFHAGPSGPRRREH